MHKKIGKILTTSTLFAIMFTLVTASEAISASWEVKVTAKTSSGARNKVSFGQQGDATDVYDPRYDVPAMPAGPISAYFPHSDWAFSADQYWRDVQGSGLSKSWDLNVDSSKAGTITLTWDASSIDGKYSAILTDVAGNSSVDMGSQTSYSYTNTGSRQFVITSEKLVDYVEGPSNLSGYNSDGVAVLKWVDNTSDEVAFIVERRNSRASDWTEVAQVGADTTSYSDSSVDFSRKYYLYRVKAINGLVGSDYSNEAKVIVTRIGSTKTKTYKFKKLIKF